MKKRVFLDRGRNDDFFNDIKRSKIDIDCVFDVGAHWGESIVSLNDAFPNASIYSFEPVTENISRINEMLAERNGLRERCKLFPVALSNRCDATKFVLHGPGAHILKENEVVSKSEVRDISRTTLDAFLIEAGLSSIDLVKIDVEGHELAVLEGAKKSLAEGRIKIFYIEAGMHKYNKHHTSFFDIHNFLLEYNYHIFGFYEQINEFLLNKLYLRRANVAFISEKDAELDLASFLSGPTIGDYQ